MRFLRTRKLHIATLFLSVFIGGAGWMLVGPAVLNAQLADAEPYHTPTERDTFSDTAGFGDITGLTPLRQRLSQ